MSHLKYTKKYRNLQTFGGKKLEGHEQVCVPSDNTHYIVNTAGSLSRKVKATDGTQFCSPSTGFSVVSASKQKLQLHMIDKEGKEIHCVSKEK